MLFGSKAKKNKTIPLLTLRDTILFPQQVKSLIVGRTQSVATLLKADAGDKSIVLVMQQSGDLANPDIKDLHAVGVLSKILQVLRLPDNKYRVLIRGEHRVRINAVEISDLLWFADADIIQVDTSSDEIPVLVEVIHERFEQLSLLDSSIPEEMVKVIQGTQEPQKLADSLAQHFLSTTTDMQDFLETENVLDQLNKIIKVIQHKADFLEVDKKIQERVKQQMDRNQREYYLNEKIQAIHKELGEEDGDSEYTVLQEQIKQSGMSSEAEEKATRELKRLQKMSSMSAEATVSRSYLDWMVSLPWSKIAKESTDLQYAQEVLDRDHYGLVDVKKRIVEYLAVRQVAPKGKSPILCLVGPPGIGKTSLARSIADATGRPYARQALGGVRDESEIRGHRRTYIGSMPGKLLQTLKRAQVQNPVFLLDEIDKMTGDYRHGDPAAALLEALDPEQNSAFRDHYIDVDYDLSQVLFICTANDASDIPAPLLDRLEVLQLSSYTEQEKMVIAEKHVIPKQLAEHNLLPEQLAFTQDAIVAIIRQYTKESGVRELERQIAKVCRKVVTHNVQQSATQSIAITLENVVEYLGARKYLDRLVLRPPQVGVINGLAVTPWGGELLEIEVAKFAGKGEILLTGRLGDWLKESARAGMSCIRMRQEALEIESNFYNTSDIHVHYPGNPLKTDGPSAGLAMTCAMISTLTAKPIRADVAMTGEISLRGTVLAIGGVKEKLLAAYVRGMKLVFLPKENEANIDDLPAYVRESMDIRTVSSIDEVLPHIFA